MPRSNRQQLAKDSGNSKPADDFVSLIERATILLVESSACGEDGEAQKLTKRAIDRMIRAAHSPFFGGCNGYASFEGIELVQELVFEQVRDELTARGYIPYPSSE